MGQRARTAKQIGAILRRERKQRSLTQEALGKQIGLRQATISNLEAGSPATRLQTLFDALAALEVEIVVERRGRGAPDDIERVF